MKEMQNKLGMQEGVVVPFDLAKQLQDAEEQKKFTERAGNLLQK